MAIINPGHYRHRVAIQEPVTSKSTSGYESTSWQDFALTSEVVLDAVAAEVLTGAGREVDANQQRQAEIVARINFPWFPGLTEAMRIVWQGVPYNIASIETDASGRMEYRTRCTAGLTEGD